MKGRVVCKRIATLVMALSLVATSVAMPQTDVYAASKSTVKSVVLKVNSKKVTKKTITLKKGEKATVKVTVKPSSAKKKIVYKSNKKKVAQVSKKGVITAKADGTAKITVTVTGKDGKKKSTFVKVKVEDKKPDTTPAPTTPTTSATPSQPTVTSEPANPSTPTTPSQSVTPGVVEVTDVVATMFPSTTIKVAGSALISAQVRPENATNKTLTYESLNPEIAVVNEVGAVVGTAEGNATIRVTAANGKFVDVQVVVTNAEVVPVTAVTMDKGSVEVTVSGTTTLKATVAPANATNKSITWSTEDPNIASVTQDGVVKGVAAGTTVVKATANDGSGYFAECTVTVKQQSILTEGITAEVTNPYTDNEGKEYPNTVLIGDDMSIRVRVVNAKGEPTGNSQITLNMEPLYGNCDECFEIRDHYVSTDNDGYAVFTLGLTSEYAGKMNAVTQAYQSFSVTATESSSNKKAEITVSFAYIDLTGILVENNRRPDLLNIDPYKTAAEADDGIYASYTTNAEQVGEYVTSQQVSSKDGKIDHKVYFNAEPNLVLPATRDTAHLGDWEVQLPMGKETGVSGSYSVYNAESNETTTTVVQEVPAGLQYVRLHFDKINLSKYTAMYVHLYDAATGADLCDPEVRVFTNNDTKGTVQVKHKTETESRLVVSLISQGQVDISNEGYVLTKVTGPWASTNNDVTTRIPLANTVTWEDVSAEYSSVYDKATLLSYEQALEYLPEGSEFLKETYKYTCQVPGFPFTGNALITVTDENSTVKAYFLYPTENPYTEENENNGNVLAPGKDVTGIHAVQIVADDVKWLLEKTSASTGTLTTEGNIAIVDATTTGATALKATVSVKGLSEAELNHINGGILYTSVQWLPVSNLEEVENVPEFYAIEGQTVTVTAQLFDMNNNKAADAKGKTVKFFYGKEEEITSKEQVLCEFTTTDVHTGIKEINTVLTHKVTVANEFSAVTDENGQVKLELHGLGMGYVENLTATTEDYNVGLSFESDVAPTPELTKGSVYWVDLGTTFVDSAVKEDAPVRTTQWDNKIFPIDKDSKSEVAKTWKIGYQPVARSKKFDFSRIEGEQFPEGSESNVWSDDVKTWNEFVSLENVPLEYSPVNQIGKTVAKDDKTITITSEKAATTELHGYLNFENVNTDEVKFKFYDENEKIVEYKNVGKGNLVQVAGNTGLKLNMTWTPVGKSIKIITPNGLTQDAKSAQSIYVQVTDNYGNKLENVEIYYAINGLVVHNCNDKEDPCLEGDHVTDANGLYKIEWDAPLDAGKCDVKVWVADDKEITTGVQIVHNDNSDLKTFEIMADDTTNEVYAVKVINEKQLELYFANRINTATIRKELFKFEQISGTAAQYHVNKVEAAASNNAVVITFDETMNKEETYTLSVNPYTENGTGIEYELLDFNGQKLEGNTYTFKPADRDTTE